MPKIKKKKKTKSSGSVSDLNSPPPLPPPRPIQSKPLPRLPTELSQTGPPLPSKPSSLCRPDEFKLSSAMARTAISGNATKEKSVLEKAGFDRPLYPALPNVYSEFHDTYGPPPMTPTAPPCDTVNPDVINAELIDFVSPVVSPAKAQSNKPPIPDKKSENMIKSLLAVVGSCEKLWCCFWVPWLDHLLTFLLSLSHYYNLQHF